VIYILFRTNISEKGISPITLIIEELHAYQMRYQKALQ
jgi:hypothetical protein